MKRLPFLALAIIFFAASPLRAHVGSPDVFYEGLAGPYHLFVTVRVPQVIPGVAEIQVRSESNDVRTIQVVPLRLTGQGSSVAPVPDLAQQSKDDPQFFTGSLWLMETGALQVRVMADGTRGKGELSVPVPSFAQTVLPMEKPLEGVMIVLLLVLTIGIISIVGAGAREAKLDPGAQLPPNNSRRARIIMVVTAVLVIGTVYLGRSWWDSEAANYQRNVNYYKPPRAETKLENGNRLIITAAGNDPNWDRNVDMAQLIPDHGHLMHLFLLSADGMNSMWHLHPDRIAGGAFAAEVQAIPAGHYQIFADIVDRRGFPWTLIGETDLTEEVCTNVCWLGSDGSAWFGAPLTPISATANSAITQSNSGTKIIWERPTGPLKAGIAMEFKFRVQDKDGKPVTDMEPYMGMAGHAEFVRSDMSVFAHVHPAGSVSMAALDLAQQSLQSGLPGDSGPMQESSVPGMSMDMPMSSGPLPPVVSFPYGFPKAGDYRIFVQIKRSGPIRVETAAFDVHVE